MKKNKFLNICLSLATFFLLLFLVTNVVTVLLWLVKFKISILHLPISFVITNILNYLLHKRKINIKEYTIIVIIQILVIALSLLIANMFMDVSFDGAWYHLTTIISMKNGWNPIYEVLETKYYGDVFINGYACKAIWAFGANVLAFFGNIDSTKIISSLISFAVLCFSLYIFGNKSKTKFQWIITIFMSILFALNPVYIGQIFTNYIDSTLGLVLTIYVLLFVGMYLKVFDFKDKTFCLICILCIALMMNIKLTGLFFAALFFVLFMIPIAIKIIKEKNWEMARRVFFTGFFGVVLGVIIGINPYITNLVHGHHIFHPIMGKDKIEVMGANVPEPMRDKSALEQIIYANATNTTSSISREDIHFKNPLKVEVNELQSFNQDTRVGGFGPLFSLVLIETTISVFIFAYFIINDKKSKVKNASIIGVLAITLMIFIFPESWWARYFVVLWDIPILFSFYYGFNKRLTMKIASIVIMLTMFANVMICAYSIYNYNNINSKPTRDYIETLEGKTIKYNSLDAAPSHMFEFVFNEYFKEKGVKEYIPSYDDSIDWDYAGFRVKIKVLDGEE